LQPLTTNVFGERCYTLAEAKAMLEDPGSWYYVEQYTSRKIPRILPGSFLKTLINVSSFLRVYHVLRMMGTQLL